MGRKEVISRLPTSQEQIDKCPNYPLVSHIKECEYVMIEEKELLTVFIERHTDWVMRTARIDMLAFGKISQYIPIGLDLQQSYR